MTICVKNVILLDICVKYIQCVKICPFVWNMLNAWKYDHLCEKFEFQWYLCKICSMCENKTICVKMWLLLDICMKYAQCVKIYPFDVLVLFLKCVQFLKYCVQFLRDTILNLIIVQFLMKKKGDAHYEGASVSPMSIKGRHVLWVHISLLPNSTKKVVNRIFSIRYSLRQAATVPIATNTLHIRICVNGHLAGPAQEAPCGVQAVWHLQSS
jgi:hypothetical protein